MNHRTLAALAALAALAWHGCGERGGEKRREGLRLRVSADSVLHRARCLIMGPSDATRCTLCGGCADGGGRRSPVILRVLLDLRIVNLRLPRTPLRTPTAHSNIHLTLTPSQSSVHAFLRRSRLSRCMQIYRDSTLQPDRVTRCSTGMCLTPFAFAWWMVGQISSSRRRDGPVPPTRNQIIPPPQSPSSIHPPSPGSATCITSRAPDTTNTTLTLFTP